MWNNNILVFHEYFNLQVFECMGSKGDFYESEHVFVICECMFVIYSTIVGETILLK